MSALRQDAELLAWAAAKIQEAQRANLHGTITFHIEAGTIIRSELKQLDKPGGNRVKENLTAA